MPNYQYQHRAAARVAAWYDLVFLLFKFALTLMVFFMLGDPISERERALTIIWFFVFLFEGIRLLAVCALFWATKVETPPQKALKLISFWRFVTITFLVLHIISVFFTLNLAFLFNLLYLWLLRMVNFFKEELESHIIGEDMTTTTSATTGQGQSPSSVESGVVTNTTASGDNEEMENW